MKFIHIADLHLDAPFVVLNSRTNIGQIRRMEQRDALRKIINYIKENSIPYLFISGDLYENEHIRESTIEYINSLFRQIPDTKIFIAPGNHDPFINNSYYNKFNWSKNVYIFSPELQMVEDENVDIYGLAFTDFYSEKLDVEKINIKNKEKINILLIHGTIDGSEGNIEYNPMKKSELKKMGFDYIALGHIHKPSYNDEENQNIVYPGSTISLGFDELGKHGMILGNIQKNSLDIQFIPIDNREFKEIELNITDILDEEQIVEKINDLDLEEDVLYKVILTGERHFEINIYDLYKLNLDQKVIKLKDNTKISINIEEISKENNLRGMFIKEFEKEIQKGEIDKEILDNVLEIGLDVLKNK